MAHRVMGRSFGKNGRRIFFRYIYRVLGFQATDSSRHSLQYHLSIYRSKKRFIQGPILPLRLLSLPPPLGPLLLRFFLRSQSALMVSPPPLPLSFATLDEKEEGEERKRKRDEMDGGLANSKFVYCSGRKRFFNAQKVHFSYEGKQGEP